MEEVIPDIHEQIFARLDVKALIICKCVCKSWHSLISSSRFVKTQLKVSNAIGPDRRILMMGNRTSTPAHYLLVGSCNGLVCILQISDTRNKVLVANPSTREVKTLRSPKLPRAYTSQDVCWGFGYDSSTDDYKVIVGHMERSIPAVCFQMVTLKSNVWIDTGKVNPESIISTAGTLCAGKLHWFVRYQIHSRVILSFDLSTDEVKEIPVPDGIIRKFHAYGLGVIKDCLCIYQYIYNNGKCAASVWVVNEDDVNQPWEPSVYNYWIRNQVVHLVKPLDYLPNKSIFSTDDVILCNPGLHFSSPIYVPSLVSPHANGRPKEKEADKKHAEKC